ncbi:MAG: hypothetical protein K9K93_03455 [Acholeplasmataceae bacterium]|nr:hypothetical protein [Acholeplasmataceae bacterium]
MITTRMVTTSLKMGLVFVVASVLARLFGLEGWLTGGLLALLSIQQTKKDSVVLATKRVFNAALGLLMSTVFFLLFGYTFAVFAVFVLIFAFLSWVTKTQEGIVPTLVLVSQLLLHGDYDLGVFLNVSGLMGIAIVVALSFNVFFPSGAKRAFLIHMEEIDTLLKDHLFVLSLAFSDQDGKKDYDLHRSRMDVRLETVMRQSRLMDKDLLFDNDHRYLSYLEMRHAQITVANRMYDLAGRITKKHPNTEVIAAFIKDLVSEIGHYDRASELKIRLSDMLESYRKSALPETREAFEVRAVLYQTVFELGQFLEEKIRFHDQYPIFP